MGLLDRGRAALAGRLAAAAGRPVTYTRGAQSVTLTAWVGRTVYRRAAEEPGAAVIWGERDYLFAAAGLVLGGAVTVPRKGDRITDPAEGITYEVSTPTGEDVWRYSDQTRDVLRVHCKRVG